MSYNKSNRLNEISEAVNALATLEIPTHLQSVALEYLLKKDGSDSCTSTAIVPFSNAKTIVDQPSSNGLRQFIETLGPTNAVSQIPCLLFWARENEAKDSVDERGIIELFRRAGLRPPGNVLQSLRDLSSKKYGRIDFVEGKPGHVQLSVAGETFVLHDVRKK